MDTNAIVRYKVFGNKAELTRLVSLKTRADLTKLLVQHSSNMYASIVPKSYKDLSIPMVSDGHVELAMYNKWADVLTLVENPKIVITDYPDFKIEASGGLKDILEAQQKEVDE